MFGESDAGESSIGSQSQGNYYGEENGDEESMGDHSKDYEDSEEGSLRSSERR